MPYRGFALFEMQQCHRVDEGVRLQSVLYSARIGEEGNKAEEKTEKVNIDSYKTRGVS